MEDPEQAPPTIAEDGQGLLPIEDETSIDFTIDEALESLGFGRMQWKVFFLVGYHWLAVAMQVFLLTIIQNACACEFNLTDKEEANVLTTAAGIGFLIGSTVWGLVSDKYGRRITVIASTFVAILFGVISAFSPTYSALLFFRAISTFGVAGNIVSFTLSMEMFPRRDRGWSSMIIAIFSAVGACFNFILAAFIMPTHGWRPMIIAGTLPMIVVLLFSHEIPESPHWLVAADRRDEAYTLLRAIEHQNNVHLPFTGSVISRARVDGTERRAVSILFSRRMRSLSFKIFIAWFVCGFCYYGAVLMQQEMLAQEKSGVRCDYKEEICNAYTNIKCGSEDDMYCLRKNDKCIFQAKNDDDKYNPCGKKLSKNEYLRALLANFGEVPGLTAVIFVLGMFHRRTILCIAFLLSAGCFALLAPCSNRNIETGLFFVICAAAGAYFQVVFLKTSEVYPAEVRSSAMGISAAISRIGLIMTPSVSGVLGSPHAEIALAVYALACTSAAIACITIPLVRADEHEIEHENEETPLLETNS